MHFSSVQTSEAQQLERPECITDHWLDQCAGLLLRWETTGGGSQADHALRPARARPSRISSTIAEIRSDRPSLAWLSGNRRVRVRTAFDFGHSIRTLLRSSTVASVVEFRSTRRTFADATRILFRRSGTCRFAGISPSRIGYPTGGRRVKWRCHRPGWFDQR